MISTRRDVPENDDIDPSCYAICCWELGCHGRDTSEFSNAIGVE